MERDLLSGTRTLSQDAGTTAYVESEKKAKPSKSQIPFIKKQLSSSTEPLLEEYSGSQSQEGKPENFPVEIVPPPPVKAVNETTATNAQRKKKRRKSGEIKFGGEGTKSKSKAKPKRKTEHDRLRKSAKGDEEAAQDQQESWSTFKMSEGLPEERELPLPGEIAEAAANEALMTGAGETEEEDFILEPPLKFSQSSVDYLDDFGDVEDSGPLSMDFAPPPESSEDEIEEEPHPPAIHDKQPHTLKAPKSTSEKLAAGGLEAMKKKYHNQKPPEKATGTSKSGTSTNKTELMDLPSAEDEWKELDYPVKNPPRLAPEMTTTGHDKMTFPCNQQNGFDEFAHRDALEEEEDDKESELGVVLDEDVAALLW